MKGRGGLRRLSEPVVIAGRDGYVLEGVYTSYPVRVLGSRNVTIRGCHFDGVTGTDALKLRDSFNVRIVGNRFTDCTHSGIALGIGATHNEDVVVDSNHLERVQTLRKDGHGAVQVRANTGPVKNDRGVRVTGNTIRGAGKVGVGLDGCDGAIVSGNHLMACGVEGIAFTGRRLTITQNQIEMPPGGGACLMCWADDATGGYFNEDIIVSGNHLTGGDRTKHQCIAFVPNGPGHIIRRVILRGNVIGRAKIAVQGYSGGGSGLYGIDGLVYAHNIVTGCGHLLDFPAWPVKDLHVDGNLFVGA